jgi:uncharacterized low-complexity protein
MLAASSVRIFMGVQTLYVLVSGVSFANARGLAAQKMNSMARMKHQAEVANPGSCGDSRIGCLAMSKLSEQRESSCSADARNEYFALDTNPTSLHSEITS